MKKKIAALVMTVLMAVSLAGCSKTEVLDGTLVAATLDGTTEVPLGEISLMLRYDQAEMQSTYGSLFGYDNMYGEDMYGDGTLYGEYAKESLIEEFELLYVLEAEASDYGVEITDEEAEEIAEAAALFIEENSEEAVLALGVDEEMAGHVLTLYTIQDKMYDALTADADIEVTDEEAAQKTVSYVYVSTSGTETDDDGNTIDLTDEELEELMDRMELVLEYAEEYGDLDEAAAQVNIDLALDESDEELAAYDVTYGADDSPFAYDEIYEAAEALDDGESVLVELDDYIYVLFMVTTFDEEATEEEKVTLLEEKIDDYYDEACDALIEEHEFVTDDDVLALLTFDRAYVLADEDE